MNRTLIATLAAIALARTGAAQSADHAKLREAVKLPQMSINFQFHADLGRGFGLHDDPTVRIAALRKTLHGDSSDADIYNRIGELYNTHALNANKQAQEAFAKAIPLYRKQLETQPRNGWILAQLGSDLFQVHEYAEAEKMLREAVRVAPQDWRTWAELGTFVQNNAVRIFVGNGKTLNFSANGAADLQQKLDPILNKKLSSEQIALLQQATEEAHTDFDRAVALKPDAPEPYERRSSFFFIDTTTTQNIVKIAKGEKPDYTGFLSSRALDDIWKAASLAPDDMTVQVSAATFEMLHGMAAAGDKMAWGQAGNIDRMPETSRERLHAVILLLRTAADANDTHKAAIAATGLADFYLVDGDMDQATQMAARALRLNSTSTSAWEALCISYLGTKKFTELAAALEERIKHDDSPYHRLMLAKAYEKQKNTSLASQTVLSALKRFPDDFLLNLAAATVLMKQTEADALPQAEVLLTHAQALLTKMSAEDKNSNRLELDVARSVYLALTGKAALAKAVLQRVLTEDSDNKNAQELIAVLEASP
jgi:tetratricopeptide (TPR) repeat protein